MSDIIGNVDTTTKKQVVSIAGYPPIPIQFLSYYTPFQTGVTFSTPFNRLNRGGISLFSKKSSVAITGNLVASASISIVQPKNTLQAVG